MGGSLSHLYLDLKGCLLYRQVEVTTRTQAKQQITLLQDVVRQLKHYFNRQFDALFQLKDETLDQVNKWLNSLRAVMRELKQCDEVMSGGKASDSESKNDTTGVPATNAEHEKIFQMGNFFWSPEENPELDLPILNENDNEDDVFKT